MGEYVYRESYLESIERKVKELEAQNEVMREALRGVGTLATPNNVKSASDEAGYYINIANEALKKIGEV